MKLRSFWFDLLSLFSLGDISTPPPRSPSFLFLPLALAVALSEEPERGSKGREGVCGGGVEGMADFNALSIPNPSVTGGVSRIVALESLAEMEAKLEGVPVDDAVVDAEPSLSPIDLTDPIRCFDLGLDVDLGTELDLSWLRSRC
jgi:hypothetical protein